MLTFEKKSKKYSEVYLVKTLFCGVLYSIDHWSLWLRIPLLISWKPIASHLRTYEQLRGKYHAGFQGIGWTT